MIVVVAIWRFALAASGASPARTFNGLDTRADALMVGCALALLPPAGLGAVRRLAGFWAVPVALMMPVLFGIDWTSPSLPKGGFTFVAMLCVWILAGAVYSRGILYRLLSSRPFVWLGKRSYSFYLWHLPIIHAALVLPFSRDATVVPILGLSLIAAYLSYAFVERPFLQLKTRFEPAPVAVIRGEAAS